jgi:hypothetical protein
MSERIRKQISENKILPLILTNLTKLKFRKDFLIKRLINYRNECANKIISLFKGYKSRIEFKKKLFYEITKENRKNAIKKIKELPKLIKYRGKILQLLKKKKDYFFISTSLSEAKILRMYPLNEKPIDYKFEKNNILNLNIVFIKKTEIKGLLQKIHLFNSEGHVVIDPLLQNDFIDDSFYNLLNFKKLLKEEKEQIEDNKKLIKQYFVGIKKNTQLKGSISHQTLNVNFFNQNTISRFGKSHKSLYRLNKVESTKSILKERPKKRIPSQRKISFGNIQFSY